MVFVLGIIAIVAGDFIPESVDRFMGRVVGITLIVLGLYVFYALIRHGRDFRMRSRWMLILNGIRGLVWRLRGSPHEVVVIEHEHEHVTGHGHEHLHEEERHGGRITTITHSHAHRHVSTVPEDVFADYTAATATGIGVIHGIGAETPTQVLVLVAAAGAGGSGAGIAILAAFLVGLFSSNSLVALAATSGFLRAGKSFVAYASVAVLTGAFSLALGILLLVAREDVLPELFV